MNIEITTNPSDQDAKTISQGIIKFNNQKVTNLEPNDAEVKFSVFAKNENAEVVGGIRASCFWNTLHIDLLWLSDDCRGKGTGKALIETAEQFAIKNHCEKAFVETTSWQAKPFYEKVGFKLMATLHDRPKGHASHYLGKDL